MNRGDIKGLLYGLFIGGLLLGPACVWADGVGAMRRAAQRAGANLSDVNQNIDLRSDHSINWSNSADNTDTLDVGIDRDSAGILQVTNGSTGTGSLLAASFRDTSSTPDFQLSSGSLALDSAGVVRWTDTAGNAAATPDVGLERAAAGVVGVTDGSTAGGGLRLGTATDAVATGDFSAGTASASRIFFDQSAGYFYIYDSANEATLWHDSSTPQLRLSSDNIIAWSSTTDATGALDVALVRKSASVLELTEGGAAGTARGDLYVDEFRIGTSDGDSNDVRMQTAGAGVLLVSNAAANAGTVRTYTKFELNGSHIEGTTAGWSVKDTGVFSFSSTTAASGTKDLGLARDAASVGRITDGSTGIGSLLHSLLVEANTDVSATPNAITAAESGSVFTNEGATAENHHDLPTAAAGLTYTFVCVDGDGIQVNAATGDTIRITGSVSAAAGLIETTTIGTTVTLVAVNATEWIAVAVNGVWTVT